MSRYEVPARRRLWPFALAIVVFACLSWWVLGRERDARHVRAGEGDVVPAASEIPVSRFVPGTAVRTAEVERFLDFATGGRPQDGEDSTPAYAAAGVGLLADALASLAPHDRAGERLFGAQLDTLGALAADLLRESRTQGGARIAREAFGLAGEVLAELQRRRFPAAADEVMHARRAAWGLVDTRALPGQGAAVQRFFEGVAGALEVMTTGRVDA